MNKRLEVRLFGKFEVQHDGKRITISSRPAQSLFAYLILNAGTSYRREKLAGMLWPDSLEETARDNLRHALWRLRKALKAASSTRFLHADDQIIRFEASSDYWLDVASLETADQNTSADELIAILSEYQGELMPGFYDEWVVLEREHLYSIFEHHTARLMSLLQEESRWFDILDWGERWIKLGQKPEPAYRALMTAHAAKGDMSKVAAMYERCITSLKEFGVAPSKQTRILYKRLRAGEEILETGSAIPVEEKRRESPKTNLPVPITSFIGRERELEMVEHLLSTTRLLTLFGTGGLGKTRLAIQAVNELVQSYRDGIWWVDLVALTDPALVPQTVAAALDVREVPNQLLVETLASRLGSKQVLLVLDNCEHLVIACARLAEQLLGACANLKILATSREALGITGETILRVPSLSFPVLANLSQFQNLKEFESVQLFVERAAAVQPGLALTQENAFAVTQICHRLDGIPLAIELAAARTRVLSLKEIAARLNDRFNLLTQGSRTALPRHQTLRAAMDWSYDLLSEREKILFRRLSVFAGGWRLAAAESVVAGNGLEHEQVLDLLSRLVDKSFVIVEELDGSARYRMLETIRQYAREKLSQAGETERLAELHFDYFLKFAEDAEPWIDSPRDLGWMRRVEVEQDNVRGSFEWGIERKPSGVLRTATALTLFWISHSYEAEGRRWIDDALCSLDRLPKSHGEAGHSDLAIRAKALQALLYLTSGAGDHSQTLVYYEQATNLARELGDEVMLARALAAKAWDRILVGDTINVEGWATESLAIARKTSDNFALGIALVTLSSVLSLERRDFKVARRYAEEGVHLLQASGRHPFFGALSIFCLGNVSKLLGHHAEARRRFSECLSIFRELGDKSRINVLQSELAHIERFEGHYQEAKRIYRETILAWQSLGHRGAVANQLECLAFIAKVQGRKEQAMRLFGAAQALREKIRMPMSPVEQVEYDREVTELRTNADEQILTSAWAEGRAMTLEQAVEFALKESE